MEDITQQISSSIAGLSPHGTLFGIIKNRLNNQITKKRKAYWGVTDITNPLQTYFRIKYPQEYKDTIETKKRFAMGNKQHAILQKKLESLEGFVDREIILDGRILGVDLVGRVDAKVKDNIWEIKSKETLPNNKEELLEKYPQDVEQLCFYSILDPELPKENILIFTTHSDFNKIKAFRIIIKNLGKVKNLALTRINQLNDWLDSKETPTVSFRCRYCNDDCSIKIKNLCTFFENASLPCGVEKFIEVVEALEIESQLKQIKVYDNEVDYFSIFNIISSRQVLQKESAEIKEDEEEPYDNSYKKQNQQLIQNALFEEEMYISNEDLKKIKDAQKIQEINQYKSSFIKLKLGEEEKIFPLLIHISPTTNPNSLLNVSSYKKGELGIHCLNNGVNKGYLIAYFPEQKNAIRAFEISYNFKKDDLSKIKKIVEVIKSKDISRLNELPLCPEFMCRECPYRGSC